MTDILIALAGIFIPLLFGVVGWVLKMIFTSLRQLDNDIQAHKLYAAETFVSKVDLQQLSDRVMNKLDHIEDKLDSKVDKRFCDTVRKDGGCA